MAKRKRSSPSAARQAVQYGAKLRERRRELDMTLDDVAKAIGLTTSFVSDVERDRASPSVNSLLALCEVLRLRVGSLFDDGGEKSVIRRNERRPIKLGGIGVQDYLLSPSSQTRFQAILSEMQPGARGSEELYSLRADEVFVMATEGEVVINIEGELTHLLPGDSMTYDPRLPHTFHNPSRTRKTTALFVITPPPY